MRQVAGLPASVASLFLAVVGVTNASSLAAPLGSEADGAAPRADGSLSVTVKGQRLWYRVLGKGPDLLLLHGGLGGSDDFEKVVPELARSFRVVMVDRAGHGRSTDSGDPFVYSGMADEMKAFLDAVGVSSAAVLGWSDGGVVGYHLASRYPGLVTKLVAIGANVRVDGMSAETVAWIRSKTTPESLLADLPEVAASYRRLSPNPERLLSFLVRSRDLWLRDPYLEPEELKRITAPVLLVAGDRNDIRVEHLLEVRSALRDARLCVLPGASHFVVRDKPHLLLPVVLDFLLPAPAPPRPRAVTVPVTIDHGRMLADVAFVRPDGTLRAARAWVDTGDPYLTLGEPLARELGLELAPPEPGSPRTSKAFSSRTPGLRVGDLPLAMDGIRTKVLVGSRTMPGVPAEANLPARALVRLHVVFDYPGRLLTLSEPGALAPRGVPIPCRLREETGLFLVDATVDGAPVALGVDTGSSYTWVSERLTSASVARDSGRPRAKGAVGTANFFGFPFEAEGTLTRLPELRIGPVLARDVGVLGLSQELFDWYSGKSAGPVAGFLGANVLHGFRVEVDYPGRLTYWEAGPPLPAHDLDVVGVTLRPEPDGGFTVAGVAVKDGRPVVAGVLPDDRLLAVGPLPVSGASMGTVVDALRGSPGETRSLTLERDGKRLAVEAAVVRLP